MTQEQEMQERIQRGKDALAKLQKSAIASAISDLTDHRSLKERVGRLEHLLTVVATCVSGPLMTPHMVRDVTRKELLAHAAETQHNQAAYHAVVNAAYVRSRELKILLDYFVDLLKTSGVELAPEMIERMASLDRDYQRHVNEAIWDAINTHQLRKLPSLQEVEERLA